MARTDAIARLPCLACGSTDRVEILSFGRIPVENSRLYPTAEAAADVARGDLVLGRCERCGFAQNDAFNAELVAYDAAYEDSQSHSPYFRAFAERIIDELLDRFDRRGRRVLEIGCGRGDFLTMYCERSRGTGIGIDPSATREAGAHGQVEIRAETYGPGSGDYEADVVLCRHTLEHVAEPATFLRTLRGEFDARPDTVLYLEVPDTSRIATEGAFWDVYYEHCAYFDAEALTGLLARTGWDVEECRLDYAGQYLVAFARPGRADDSVERESPVPDFAPMSAKRDSWVDWAATVADRRLAVWAATSKTVGFLSAVASFNPVVAVDINPAKWGKFLPSSALGVCSPEQLAEHDIDSVLLMNPLYRDEVEAQLAELGLTPALVALR